MEKYNAHFFSQKQHGGAHVNKASLSCLVQNCAKPVDGVLVGLQPAGQDEQDDPAHLLEGKDRHPASRVLETEVSSWLKKGSEENKKKAVLGMKSDGSVQESDTRAESGVVTSEFLEFHRNNKKFRRSAKLGNGARSRNVVAKQNCSTAKNVEKSGEMSGKFHFTLQELQELGGEGGGAKGASQGRDVLQEPGGGHGGAKEAGPVHGVLQELGGERGEIKGASPARDVLKEMGGERGGVKGASPARDVLQETGGKCGGACDVLQKMEGVEGATHAHRRAKGG